MSPAPIKPQEIAVTRRCRVLGAQYQRFKIPARNLEPLNPEPVLIRTSA
jgi:hypothetical protein